MKKAMSTVLCLMVLGLFGGCSGKSLPASKTNVLFSDPANIAQKVANFVVKNGEESGFNSGTKEEGIIYSYKLYVDYSIYEIEVRVYQNGQKNLGINYYLTNLPLETLKNPADLAAHELMYGRHKIYIEEHFYDNDIDMSVDLYQQFFKKHGPFFEGFTREERDLRITKPSKSGVQDYLFDGGHERTKSGWVKASAENLQSVKEGYEKLLDTIAVHLKIK